nr:solute carrier family 22 member 3-like [Procambarus clarkii]
MADREETRETERTRLEGEARVKEEFEVINKDGSGNIVKDGYVGNGAEEGDFEELADVDSFEELLEVVGTNGRWNLLLFVLCSYSGFITGFPVFSSVFLGATPDHWCHVGPLVQANWSHQQILAFAIPYSNETGKHESCRMYDMDYSTVAELGYEGAVGVGRPADALTKPCSSRDFNLTQYQLTVTTQWDLVCERRAIYSTTQAAVQGGMLLGNLIYGYLLDRFGRRPVVLWSGALYVMAGFIAAVAPNVEVYIFLVVVLSCMAAGAYLGCFVLLMETCAIRERSKIGTLFVVPWALGYMLVPGIAYLVRTWKWLQAAITLPGLLFAFHYWLLPESPRWLILHNQHQRALEVLRGAAKINRKKLPPDHHILAAMHNIMAMGGVTRLTIACASCSAPVPGKIRAHHSPCYLELVPSSCIYNNNNNNEGGNGKLEDWQEKQPTLLERAVRVLNSLTSLLRLKSLRQRTLIIFFCWFTAAMVYYGISLNAPTHSTDTYMYIFLGGVLEVPSYLLLWPTIVFLGRIKPLTFLYLFSAIVILLMSMFIIFIPQTPLGVMLLVSLSGKMAITAAFHLIWVVTAELFPTQYRSLAVGHASVVARIGSILSPYINDILGMLVVWAPAMVFGLMSLVAGGLCLLLPESKGRHLPEGDHLEHSLPGDKEEAPTGSFSEIKTA